MKAILSILAVILTTIIQASAADKNIVDYFRALPHQRFTEGSPSYLINLITQPGGFGKSLIDSQNGFCRQGARTPIGCVRRLDKFGNK